jgi:phage recombination protein Bet
MSRDQQLATIQNMPLTQCPAAQELGLSEEQFGILKARIAPADCRPAELGLFLMQCKRTGLDPFACQIYLVRYKKNSPASIVTSIDGFRLIAERSGKYGGQTKTEWCGPDGVWKDVWMDLNEMPFAARVGVCRTDWREPLYAVARLVSYLPSYYDEGVKKPSPMWQKMPDVMLAKVAEALAIRRAFPQETSGLYTEDEMEQARASAAPAAAAPANQQAEVVQGEIVNEETGPAPKSEGRQPRQGDPEQETLKNQLKNLMAQIEGKTTRDPQSGEQKPDVIANVKAAELRLAGLLDLHPNLCPLRSDGKSCSLGAADVDQLRRIIAIYEELVATSQVPFGFTKAVA